MNSTRFTPIDQLLREVAVRYCIFRKTIMPSWHRDHRSDVIPNYGSAIADAPPAYQEVSLRPHLVHPLGPEESTMPVNAPQNDTDSVDQNSRPFDCAYFAHQVIMNGRRTHPKPSEPGYLLMTSASLAATTSRYMNYGRYEVSHNSSERHVQARPFAIQAPTVRVRHDLNHKVTSVYLPDLLAIDPAGLYVLPAIPSRFQSQTIRQQVSSSVSYFLKKAIRPTTQLSTIRNEVFERVLEDKPFVRQVCFVLGPHSFMALQFEILLLLKLTQVKELNIIDGYDGTVFGNAGTDFEVIPCIRWALLGSFLQQINIQLTHIEQIADEHSRLHISIGFFWRDYLKKKHRGSLRYHLVNKKLGNQRPTERCAQNYEYVCRYVPGCQQIFMEHRWTNGDDWHGFEPSVLALLN